MRRHFAFRHRQAHLEIAGERHERCQVCGMFTANADAHPQTSTCKAVARRRRNEDLSARQAAADTVQFILDGGPIERVDSFRYLGRILAENDSDSRCVDEQLKRARQRWARLARILKREGANARCMAVFYLTIVQAVLLYGADSWTLSRRDIRALESFHKRAVRHITGCHIRRDANGVWSYPDHDALMKKCGLFPIMTYIERRRGTLRKYLEDERPELLAEVSELRPAPRDAHRILWWNQAWITRDGVRHDPICEDG